MNNSDSQSLPKRRGLALTFWLRAAVSLGLVTFLICRTNWSPVGPLLRDLDWSQWLVALALYLASQVVSSIRWRELAAPLGFRQSLRRLVQLYFEGMFFGLCLPSSIGGDVFKAYRLAPDAKGRMLAGCTVLADRLTGLAGLLVVGLSALAARQFDLNLWQTLVVGIGLLAGMLAAFRLTFDIVRWITRHPIGRIQRGLWAKLIPYQARPEVLWQALGWSLLVQSLNILTVVWIGRAMGLNLPLLAYCVSVPLVALMTVVPVSVNGMGIREGGMAYLLLSYDLPHELGVTLGLLWFLINVASGLIGGLVYLFDSYCGAPLPADPRRPSPGSPVGLAIHSSGASGASKSLLGKSLPGSIAMSSEIISAEMSAPAVRLPRASTATVSIVVPIYNERENIRPLYDALQAVLPGLGQPYEIVLVDDGSTDGSADELQALADADSRVKLVSFRRNFGQTAAMNAGIHLATGDAIVTLDADLQNDPADIPLLLDKLDEGFDLVHGWRRERQDALVSRKLPSKIANWIISKTTRFPVHDLGCTLKAMRREIAQELQLYGEMHRFIPILAHWRGARCAEVVTRHHARRFGQSKYGLSRTLRVVLDLITVKYMTQYLTSPMKLFGSLGLGCGLVSAIAAAATVVMRFTQDLHMTHNPLLLLTVFAGMIAVQFFVFGMLGEVGIRTYYESQGKQYYSIRKLVNFDDSPETLSISPADERKGRAA